MRVFREGNHRDSISVLTHLPMAFAFRQGSPGIVFMGEEEKHIGCIRCANPRCMFFSNDEVSCHSIENFPSDRRRDVCPVNAIKWDETTGFPLVDTNQCLSCGICVSRCPVGALYFSNDGELNINTEPGEYIEEIPNNGTTQAIQESLISELMQIHRGGVMLNATDDLFDSIYEKLFQVHNNNHNTVGRNLLIALGCNCAMRRIGDVYTRMDAVYTSKTGSFGAVEIEFGRDTLDASRGILDDIAVLFTRFGVQKHDNNAVVICLQLPNARQGYWQVVKDIKNVEGIKISTITIGALMLLLWNGCTFDPEDDQYYLDFDNMDLRHIICGQIDYDDLPLSEKKLGILEPMR